MPAVAVAEAPPPTAAAVPQLPSTSVRKDAVVEYDLGHLMLFDPSPLSTVELRGSAHFRALDAESRDNVQLLLNRIFSLPTAPLPHDPGLLASLPVPVTVLPRAKPLPQPKPETRWEAFAKAKGIEKRKRGRMVWDEEKGEYAVRFGFRRANDHSQQVIIEEKDSAAAAKRSRSTVDLPMQPVEDPWTRMENERKERRANNSRQQQRNILQPAKGDRVPGTVDLASLQAQAGGGKRGQLSGGAMGHVNVALQLAQQSTASLGRFDEQRFNEPKVRAKKSAGPPPMASDEAERRREKESQMRLLTRLIGNESEAAGVDMDKAVRVSQKETQQRRATAKANTAVGNRKRGAAGGGGGGRHQRRSK